MGERPEANPDGGEFDPEKFSVSTKRALEEDAREKQHLAEARQRGLVEPADETIEQIHEKADAELPGSASPETTRRKEAKILMNEALRRQTGEAIISKVFNQSKKADALAELAAKRSHERSEKGKQAIVDATTRVDELSEKTRETTTIATFELPKLSLSYHSIERTWQMGKNRKLKLLDERTRQIDEEYMRATNGIIGLVGVVSGNSSFEQLPLNVQETIDDALSALRTIEASHQGAKDKVERELQAGHWTNARSTVEEDVELMRGNIPTLKRMGDNIRELVKKPPSR